MVKEFTDLPHSGALLTGNDGDCRELAPGFGLRASVSLGCHQFAVITALNDRPSAAHWDTLVEAFERLPPKICFPQVFQSTCAVPSPL
ncbi:hypothetical protein VTH06DRAFT_2056 [Thermothelomyces fergusii]